MLGYEKSTPRSFKKVKCENKVQSYKIMKETTVKYYSLISSKSEGKIQYYIVQ